MLKDQFGPRIDANMKNPTVRNRMRNGIGSFVDRNSRILYTLDFCNRWSFGTKERQVIYDAAGVTENEMVAAIKASKYISNLNAIQSNPFYITCMLVCRSLYALKADDDALLVATYMSLQMYTSAHYGRWNKIPNKNIMDYTIANLDKSFLVTQMNSVYEFVFDNAKTTMSTYKDWVYAPPGQQVKTQRVITGTKTKRTVIVDSGSDSELARVVDAMFTRIKQKLINIAQEFYKNHKSGKYLNYDSDLHDEENYRVMDNDSYAMDRIAGAVYLKLINHQFKSQWLKLSITQSAVSLSKLTTLFDDIIQNDEDEELRKIVLAMIEYYCSVLGNPIDALSSTRFISAMSSGYSAYAKSEQMVYIKQVLDKWVEQNQTRYGRGRYGRTAAIAYKKSLYMTLVYIINYEAKLMG